MEILLEKSEVIGVLSFSVFNEILNMMLILSLMKKDAVTKAALFGILSAVYNIIYGIVQN